MVNVTFGNIESALNQLQTEPEKPYRNQIRTQKANRKVSLHQQKFFSTQTKPILAGINILINQKPHTK
jgi:hypothetical protein